MLPPENTLTDDDREREEAFQRHDNELARQDELWRRRDREFDLTPAREVGWP